jgi:dolichol-phosphate mannosyltransferase
MSGFFMIRRESFQQALPRVSGVGFKILLDLFASSPMPLRFRELPFQFRPRHAGESKLDSQVAWEFLLLLLDKLFGNVVPVRFVAFSIVGGLGVVLHMVVLTVRLQGIGIRLRTFSRGGDDGGHDLQLHSQQSIHLS